MYTGIVTGTAPIVSIEEGDGVRLFTIDLTGFEDSLEIGASVALDGVCMTVVGIDSGHIGFDAIEEKAHEIPEYDPQFEMSREFLIKPDMFVAIGIKLEITGDIQ